MGMVSCFCSINSAQRLQCMQAATIPADSKLETAFKQMKFLSSSFCRHTENRKTHPSFYNAFFQDSDMLVGGVAVSPSVSPASAMSISPATSEVGSLKSRLLHRKKVESELTSAASAGGAKQRQQQQQQTASAVASKLKLMSSSSASSTSGKTSSCSSSRYGLCKAGRSTSELEEHHFRFGFVLSSFVPPVQIAAVTVKCEKKVMITQCTCVSHCLSHW